MTISSSDIRSVSPALDQHLQDAVLGDLWKRPALAPRDRSIITLSALITKNQTTGLPFYLNLALDNGVKPSEISEIITHLAYYSGWPNAMAAVAVTRDIFKQRGIDPSSLPAAKVNLLPLDEAAEARRVAAVAQSAGPDFQALTHYTTTLLFHDLWLRPDLAPKDRSMVTVSSLIASGQFAQIPFHLNKAMDNGLTREQASEILGHLAFYVGWPNAFSALPTMKGVFEQRAGQPG